MVKTFDRNAVRWFLLHGREQSQHRRQRITGCPHRSQIPLLRDFPLVRIYLGICADSLPIPHLDNPSDDQYNASLVIIPSEL